MCAVFFYELLGLSVWPSKIEIWIEGKSGKIVVIMAGREGGDARKVAEGKLFHIFHIQY